MTVGNIVVFKENHKWYGSIGYIDEIGEETILIGIPTPTAGLIYNFCKEEDIEDLGIKYPLYTKEE